VLASILGGVAVYSQCKKSKTTTTPVVTTQQDAGQRIAFEQPDATESLAFGADAGVPLDAGRVVVTSDAAARPDATQVAVLTPDAAQVAMITPDSAVPVARPDAQVDSGIDKAKEAAALAAKGRAALSEGEPQAAIDLFDQALKLRKDKRTYVDRGRALHNLGKTDEAVASIDEAIRMSASYAPAWEQKGLILWSAQRYGDARPALEMYLQLTPDGPKAETIRKMLDEPR
jgi:tetratricopeptide (TPR) repeat protein